MKTVVGIKRRIAKLKEHYKQLSKETVKYTVFEGEDMSNEMEIRRKMTQTAGAIIELEWVLK